MMRRIMVAALVGLLAVAAGVAAASNFSSASESDYDAPGTHRFYVWCASGGDFTATASGRDAEDAQMRLYDRTKAQGKAACWPMWQGRNAG